MPDISLADPWALFAIALALALGGILKGATGAGMPVIAVPVIASIYGVQLAVYALECVGHERTSANRTRNEIALMK